MLYEFILSTNFFPLTLNDNENSSLYCKQSQQHFHKKQKNCVFSWKTRRRVWDRLFQKKYSIEEDVFRLATSVGQRKKNLSPHEESNLMETQNFFLCPMLVWQDEKHLPLFLYRAQNLLSSAYYIYEVIVAYPSVGITLSVNHIYTSVSFKFLLSTACYNAVKTKRKFMIA